MERWKSLVIVKKYLQNKHISTHNKNKPLETKKTLIMRPALLNIPSSGLA